MLVASPPSSALSSLNEDGRGAWDEEVRDAKELIQLAVEVENRRAEDRSQKERT